MSALGSIHNSLVEESNKEREAWPPPTARCYVGKHRTTLAPVEQKMKNNSSIAR